MKLNNKNKGKVHPFFSSSSSSSSSCDPISALTLLLPAAIFALVSTLSPQDKEVLAYMITRSLNLTNTNTQNTRTTPTKKNTKKNKSLPTLPSPASLATATTHKSPCFDCECFDCYTAYWFRWDSSPHRELIHQAIEAYEEHLAISEKTHQRKNGRRREKGVAAAASATSITESLSGSSSVCEDKLVEDVKIESLIEIVQVEEEPEVEVDIQPEVERERSTATCSSPQQQQQENKGLARKVLPDVMAIFNSRIWGSLWGTAV